MRWWKSLFFLFCVPWLCGVNTELSTRTETSLKSGGIDTALSVGPRAAYSVLHIMADDVGNEGLTAACAGDCSTNMPNLQAMRDSGISFTSYWVTPACAPTRASVLTGRYGFQHGMTQGLGTGYVARRETEIPEALRLSKAGYVSGLFGKMGLSAKAETGNTAALMGLDYFWGRHGSIVAQWFEYDYRIAIYPGADASLVADPGEYLGDGIYDSATAWIQGLPTGQKFVAFLWPYHAHESSYHDPPGSVTPPGDADEDCEADPDFTGCQIAEIRYMDTKMGEVISAALTHDPTTVVMYHMDNGDALLATFGKGNLKLDGIQGELIVAYGDVPVASYGTTSAEPLMAVDMWPTILDYADVDNVVQYDRRGWSLRTLISGACTETGRLAGNCWDGTTERCQYSMHVDGRTMRCEGATTGAYRYEIANDGTNPRIYEWAVDDTVECSGAACDAAEAVYEVILPQYDGLPGPP